ncbi:helix-turn-helix domain-containing protein [Marinoscillum pacificum]|uniref:helix-turn-helix domain-containing protein n=1 Tax=Marinoscillum pacificum TaxID=392723 RepID=UPI0021588DAF|nr:helix-turn-helix domain-containing protein [Marinoscillum pacificum]
MRNKRIDIPPRKLTVFWGLSPHQIVGYVNQKPYYVCTVPFSQFLKWNLPGDFVERIIKGELIIDSGQVSESIDINSFNNWEKEVKLPESHQLLELEIHARLRRMACTCSVPKESNTHVFYDDLIKPVEEIALFIAQNYTRPIRVSDIGGAVGLHPDYANSIFKKSFGKTLSDYITEERIAHAQRLLVSSNERITKIAYASGFNSISRFNASFFKINGCTPRVFRQQNK